MFICKSTDDSNVDIDLITVSVRCRLMRSKRPSSTKKKRCFLSFMSTELSPHGSSAYMHAWVWMFGCVNFLCVHVMVREFMTREFCVKIVNGLSRVLRGDFVRI